VLAALEACATTESCQMCRTGSSVTGAPDSPLMFVSTAGAWRVGCAKYAGQAELGRAPVVEIPAPMAARCYKVRGTERQEACVDKTHQQREVGEEGTLASRLA
jgi:hypothetical protein